MLEKISLNKKCFNFGEFGLKESHAQGSLNFWVQVILHLSFPQYMYHYVLIWTWPVLTLLFFNTEICFISQIAW